MAVRSARALGLGVAGVDLIRSSRGPLVLEVNSTPGLEGVETACGVDVAGAIMDYVAASVFLVNQGDGQAPAVRGGVRRRPF